LGEEVMDLAHDFVAVGFEVIGGEFYIEGFECGDADLDGVLVAGEEGILDDLFGEDIGAVDGVF
jgi:hypothetical protein